jgi:hypothetical protein
MTCQERIDFLKKQDPMAHPPKADKLLQVILSN